jgi:hypothetical protein
MRFPILFLVIMALNINFGSMARAQSRTEIEDRKTFIRQQVSHIDRDINTFESERATRLAAIEPDTFRDPSRIDERVAYARRRVQAEHGLAQFVRNYFEQCIMRLSSLSELRLYLDRAQGLNREIVAILADQERNYQQQLSRAEQGQRAYHNQDADTWNSLVRPIAAGLGEGEALRDKVGVTIAIENSVMTDAQEFLRKELNSLDEEAVRADREAEKARVVPQIPPVDANGVSLLLFAVKAAAKTPGCTGAGECNFFVGKVAELAGVPYFNAIFTDRSSDGGNANKIYDFVSKATQGKPSGWKIVSETEAQELANRGRFVIGVARNVSPSNHGHVVLVAPSDPRQLQHAADTGSGPWVRDSKHFNESVRSSYSFCLQGSECSRKKPQNTTVKPIYAVWDYPLERN